MFLVVQEYLLDLADLVGLLGLDILSLPSNLVDQCHLYPLFHLGDQVLQEILDFL